MRSSISSSEGPVRLLTAVKRVLGHVLLVGLTFLALGEVWFRLPWTTRLLVWEFDDERGARLIAPQSRGMAMGNAAVVSPLIGINRDGFRNDDIDWRSPTLLAVGSSELLAPGIENHEVWTSILSQRVSETADRPVTVVNAGGVGYGPYHQAVTVRKFFATHPRPRLVIVRASIGDRRFLRPTRDQLEGQRRRSAISLQIKQYTEFLPFLVNKLQAQQLALRETFMPDLAAAQNSDVYEAPAVADEMWRADAEYWKEIVTRATADDVPVVFFVDAADGAASSLKLHALLSEEFRARRDVDVVLFGASELGLTTENDELRRSQYHEQFTLGYDPHSNARRHRIVAQFMTRALATRLSHELSTERGEPAQSFLASQSSAR